MSTAPVDTVETEAPYRPRREDLLTVKEYAQLMGIHVWSVYRRIQQGKQPGLVQCGGQWRIDVAQLRRPVK